MRPGFCVGPHLESTGFSLKPSMDSNETTFFWGHFLVGTLAGFGSSFSTEPGLCVNAMWTHFAHGNSRVKWLVSNETRSGFFWAESRSRGNPTLIAVCVFQALWRLQSCSGAVTMFVRLDQSRISGHTRRYGLHKSTARMAQTQGEGSTR